jgi:hypothetical protein
LRRFFIFISLHLFLFLLVIVYQAQADDEKWSIDDFGSYVVASVHGEVVWGDKLRFALMKKNCDYINVLFSFLTYKAPKDIKQIEGITIPIKINKEKLLGAAEILVISPAFNDMASFVMLSAPKPYKLNEFSEGLMKAYNPQNQFTIELMSNENFVANKYFDVTLNRWNLDQYPEKIAETYSKCVGDNFKDIETHLSFKFN